MQNSIFLLFLFLIISSGLYAQDQTIGTRSSEKNIPVKQGKIMLIPFDDKMYYSEFDREIAEQNQMTFNDIRAKFRKAIDTSLYSQLIYDHSVIALLYKMHPDHAADLEMMYGIRGYSWEPVPALIPDKPVSRLTTFRSRDEKTQNGQLVTQQDDSEKFMAAVVSEKETLNRIAAKYGTEYFVFINQLDFRKKPGTGWEQIQMNDFSREFKIHYTITDKNGKRIKAGAVYKEITSKENNIYSIIQKGLAPSLKEIIDAIPGTGE
jgi:hypothetical protein